MFSGGQKSFKSRSGPVEKCNQMEMPVYPWSINSDWDSVVFNIKLEISNEKQLGNNSNNYIVSSAYDEVVHFCL